MKLKNHKKYNEITKAFWIQEFLIGRKSYEYHRKLFNGPSINSVKKWMKELDIPKFEEFLEIQNLEKIINFWKNIYGFSTTAASLSIDAMKIDEDLILKSSREIIGLVNPINLEYNPDDYRKNIELYRNLWNKNYVSNNVVGGMFIFTICPHSRIPSFPVHVYLSCNGFANKTVDDKMFEIQKCLKNLNIYIKIFSTDSDTHYRNSFNNQFDYISKALVANPSFKDLNLPDPIYSNDISHLLKRARSRLVKRNCLFINKSDQILFKSKKQKVFLINPELLKDLDKSLTDCHFRNNGLDSMDDFYPNAMFKGFALGSALQNKEWAAVLYLLPTTCMNRILRDKTASRGIRAIWCYVGLFLMFFYWSSVKLEMSSLKKECKSENFDSLFSLDFCIDCINGLFSILISIENIQESCSISRIGTIQSEHFFALLRQKAGNEQTLKTIAWAFNRIIQSKKWDYFVDEKVHRRDFETGMFEEGCFKLSDYDINKCRIFAIKIFKLSGQVFPRESAAYDLVQNVEDIDLDFDEWENNLLESLIRNDTYRIRSNRKQKCNWELRVTQFRFPSKIGRNIKSRYSTKINY